MTETFESTFGSFFVRLSSQSNDTQEITSLAFSKFSGTTFLGAGQYVEFTFVGRRDIIDNF